MLNRIFTGIGLASFFLLLLLLGNGFIIGILFSIIAIYGYYEWLAIQNNSMLNIYFFLLLAILIMILLLRYHTHSIVLIFTYFSIFLWLMMCLDLLLKLNIYKKFLSISSSIVGLVFIVITWFLFISLGSTSNIEILEYSYLLFSHSELSDVNKYYLFLISIVSLTDISGYFVGKTIGKNSLCPSISPKKTVEGFIGSLIIPLIIFFILFNFVFSIPILISDVIFMLLCCIFCTVGDLSVSVYKRFHNVKDSGNILPGHGGILDRLDSYLPTISILHIWLFL
ncbi:MAG: phosphatidate cytidylyltransferase [Gammaproteobacteria bacterium]|nr:phosphatidate cytidylyltransferase [Gammaproteobacteria bacterium]|tara:strand:+ start:3828 stop:4673 length:846 start_codon:yes stop_codon:yes gene_type:complete